MKKTEAQYRKLSAADRRTYDLEWVILHLETARDRKYLANTDFAGPLMKEAQRLLRIRKLAAAVKAEIEEDVPSWGKPSVAPVPPRPRRPAR